MMRNEIEVQMAVLQNQKSNAIDAKIKKDKQNDKKKSSKIHHDVS